MAKLRQILLIYSLVFNLAFLGASGLFVYCKVGISFASKFVAARKPPKANVEWIDSPLYLERESTYSALPRRDAPIIFVGDSITDSCPWNELFQRPDILNRGIGWDRIEGVQRRMNEVLRHRPRQLFLMIGINDLMHDKKKSDVLVAQYRSLIQAIRTSSPQTQIILQGILPVNNDLLKTELPNLTTDIVQVNQGLAKMADGNRIVYVDLYSHFVGKAGQLNSQYTFDGIHLNGTGYMKWREVIRPYLATKSEKNDGGEP